MEGEVGTWSHCGKREPHVAHTHTIYFNEGPYPGIVCAGTPERPAPVPGAERKARALIAELVDAAWKVETERTAHAAQVLRAKRSEVYDLVLIGLGGHPTMRQGEPEELAELLPDELRTDG